MISTLPHSMFTEGCMFHEEHLPQIKVCSNVLSMFFCVFMCFRKRHKYMYVERESNEQLKKFSEQQTKRQTTEERLVHPGREKETKWNIRFGVSLMTQDPHGTEGKSRSQRDMMNSETDNLKPQHSQSTDTHIHTESWKKNYLRNYLHSSVFYFSISARFSCFFLWLRHHTMVSIPRSTSTCTPALCVLNMSGWLWHIKPTQYTV